MKYITVIDEEMLQYFRVDDDGKEKVLVANGRGFLLRPLPTKKVPVFDPNHCDLEKEKLIVHEIEGYNKCLDEILGETYEENDNS